MKRLAFLMSFLLSVVSHADGWKTDWYSSVRMAGSTGRYMPFHSRVGEDGILPVKSSSLVSAGADVSYLHRSGFGFDAGMNLVGAIAMKSPLNPKSVYGLIDRIYISGAWKMIHLDLGMRPRERELSELSVSGGNVVYSRNTRNMPGINIWTDWIYFEKGHKVGIKGNLSHYNTIDSRYVSGAMIHNKSLALKFAFGRKVDFMMGFEHWAQWGGHSPVCGKQPASFKDYLRVFMGAAGGDNATNSDQLNVLGNHLGREVLRVDWRHKAFTMTFQYDKPFEDGSGIKYRNAPDGIWSVQCSFQKRDALVTDVIFEYINTTWQTGPEHDRPATKEEMEEQDPNDPFYGVIVLGGRDTYFSNGEYCSGWTHFGRIIGLPLILPAAPDADGIVRRVVSTRLRGVHAGIKGLIASKIPYSFKATYTINYGNYAQSSDSFFVGRPQQLSLALEAGFGRYFRKLPMDLQVGIYGDVGKVYGNSAGLTLRLSYNDFRRF